MNKEPGTPPELEDEKINEQFEGFEGFGAAEDGSDGENSDSQQRWPLEAAEPGARNEISSDTQEERMSHSLRHADSEVTESTESTALGGERNLDMPWMDQQQQQQQSLDDETYINTTALTQRTRVLPHPIVPAISYSRSSFRGRLPWPAMEEIKELPEPLLPAVTESGLSLQGEKKALGNEDFTSPEITTMDSIGLNVDPTNHNSTATAVKPSCTSRPSSSKSEADHQITESATFRVSRKGEYTPLAQSRLRNNLLASVGFLEFGNATDFAANVWNTIPVPIYAAVLMGLGGGVAIILSLFAIRDAVLSWRNIRILREERAMLIRRDKNLATEEGEVEIGEVEKTAEVDAMRLEVNRRELGSEIIDRFSMDILMGFGAFIVGVGTELAIGGANPHVYHASNLLSGYIGNSPSLLWGLCNTLWSIYVFKRAGQHLTFGIAILQSQAVKERLRSRVRLVQMHSFMLGLATLISGPGGMVTVTRWWGYVMLIPCIIANIWGNFLWRKQIGYERPLARMRERLWSRSEIVTELEWVLEVERRLDGKTEIGLTELLETEMMNVETIVEFIVRSDLFEDFCWKLLKDKSFTTYIEGASESEFTIITPRTILATSSELSSLILSAAQLSFRGKGRIQLAWKERYLFEMLGARLCVEHGNYQTPGIREAQAQGRRASHAMERKMEGGENG
jgi:hypothetical protein